jgi:nucleoid DNA-binding protein
MLQGDRRKVATITKKKVIQRIARQTGMHPAEVRMVIQGFLDGITEDLTNGDRVEFRDFGVFEVVVRKAKIGRNPKKAKIPVVIPQRKQAKFTPGKALKEKIIRS